MKKSNVFNYLYLLLLTAVTCDNFRIINQTNTWDKADQLNLNQAKKYCSSQHMDGYRCLRVFIKKQTNTYNAVCGWEEGQDIDE